MVCKSGAVGKKSSGANRRRDRSDARAFAIRNATPSRNATNLPDAEDTRSPGTRMPDEIERIRRGERNRFAVGLHPRIARSDSSAMGRRELLAQKSADESPAAHFAAIFQAPQRRSEVRASAAESFRAPALRGRPRRIAAEASSKWPRARSRDPRARRNKAATIGRRCAAAAPCCPRAMAGAPLRIDQRAQIVEAVGGDHSRLRRVPTAPSRLPLSGLPVPRTMSAKNEAPR